MPYRRWSVCCCARKINLQRLPTLEDVPPMISETLNGQPDDFVFVRVAGARDRLLFK